jgi:hypothetical protein
MAPAAPGQETQAALDRLKQGGWIGLVASAFTFAIGVLAVTMVVGADNRTSWVHAAGFPIHVLSFIMQVIAVSVVWMGLDDLKDAAREIHSQHQNRFKRAWNWLLLAGLVWLLGGIACFLFGGFAFFNSLVSGSGAAATSGVFAYQLSMGAVGLIINVLIALVLQQSLADLMQKDGRALVNAFYALAIGGTAASFALSLASTLLWSAPNIAPVASAMSVLALFVLIRQLNSAKAGTRVITELRTGDPDASAGAPPAPPSGA